MDMKTKRTFVIVTIIAVTALAGAAGLTVMATGSGSGGEGGGIMGRLGHHIHGGGHHADAMGELIEQLELKADQQQHLEKIHEILGEYHGRGSGSMHGLHNELVGQFRQGRLETDLIRGKIDEHLEQLRHVAYAGTDELVALINGLDTRQREILLQHLQQADHHSHDH